jgi:hypothetical protein
MNLLHIGSAVVWVDFVTLALHRVFNLGSSLDKWYTEFGIVAVMSDCLSIVLVIMIAKIYFPRYPLLLTAIVIQIVHDLLFYLLVILPIPRGTNQMMDVFKDYSVENGWKILVADSLMVGSTVLIGKQIVNFDTSVVQLFGLFGAYALTYIIYTN